MELAPEDSLRLNVLLARRPQAIRINETTMTVHGLADQGEARVELHPTGRDELYIKSVKEIISGHVLGSPGGYPVYLQRWTRMGQMRDDNLEQMLMLGEPEAVVAVVGAPGLTDELARRAWWAMEDADNARAMLCKQAVVNGQMGPILAAYLVEHLPFETEAEQMVESVRLVLQPGLLPDDAVADLWRKAQRKHAYYLGFLATRPDNLPTTRAAHSALSDHGGVLAGDAESPAWLLGRAWSAQGQTYLETVLEVLRKPGTQDVVNKTFELLADYCAAARPDGAVDQTLEELVVEATAWVEDLAEATALRSAIGESTLPALRALRVLSGLGYGALRPVFGGSTASGSLMRRRLEPVMTPLAALIHDLLDATP